MSRQTAIESPSGGPTRDVPRGENVLVLASSMDPAADEACGRLVGDADGLLVVSLTQAPDDRLDTIAMHTGRPGRVAAVSCDATRGAAAATAADPTTDPRAATVSDPGDLTGLGIHVERLLSGFDHETDVTVCVHSLTTLLQYADPKAVFRLCHAMTRAVADQGASAHFHLDPTTVDDRTLRTMRSLFDRTVEA
jgi:hypothetical protein